MTGTTPSSSATSRPPITAAQPPITTAQPPTTTAQPPSTDAFGPIAPILAALSETPSQAPLVSVMEAGAATNPHRLRDDPRLPACLVSTIVHTLILLILALFTFREGGSAESALLARQGEPSSVLTLQAVEPKNEPAFTPRSPMDQPVTVPIEVLPQEKLPFPLNAAAPKTPQDAPQLELNVLGSSSSVRLPGSGGLERRTPEGRQEFGERYGATPESEQAVEAALAYLAAHQRDNGSWSFDLNLDPCNGRCRNGKKPGTDTPTPSTGATGLALLAFLGAGHTHHHKGPYQETVRRGIYYLRSVAAEAQAGYDWQQGSMYGHGIALMALAEALAMTREGDQYDADLLDLVQRGSSFTCIAQHGSGSWGYVPGSPGDITVTGWQVMSLVAARKAGATLHTNTLRDAKEFVMSTCTDRDFWFGYKGPPGEPTTTAIGLTLMLYLGQSPHETPFAVALTNMAHRGPMLNNIYHDYYATLALHHSRHWAWDEWNQRLRDHLVATQEKTGHEKGSWHFPDRWGDIGGRLYTTAMCAMTLEVYYRYMPLYESLDGFPL
jgi:hypothetical protein